MSNLELGDLAPDFSLPDHQGAMIKLSEIFLSQNVLLVFNIGFA